MPCTLTLTGRAFPCNKSVGSIKRVYATAFNEGLWEAVSSGEIPDASSAVTLYGFEVAKNTSSLVQSINSSIENGTIFFTQTLSVTFPNLSAADNVQFLELTKARVAWVVEDFNGNRLVVGHTSGAEVSGGEITTGAAKGDLSGYTIEFVAEEAIPAPHLAASTTDATLSIIS